MNDEHLADCPDCCASRLPADEGAIQIAWDEEVNLAYIRLGSEEERRDARPVRTLEVRFDKGANADSDPGCFTGAHLDVSSDGRLVGIEFLDAARRLPHSLRPPIRLIREQEGIELTRDDLVRLGRPDILAQFDRRTEAWKSSEGLPPGREPSVLPVLRFFYQCE